jgi:hypothetical protein
MAVIRQSRPNASMTFNFGYRVRPENGQKAMKTFYNVMQRSVYGRDWAKQKDRAWPVAFGFFEHPDTNPHYHVLANLDRNLLEAFEMEGEHFWQSIVRRGQFEFEAIYELEGVLNYFTKRLAQFRTFGDLWIYNDTRACSVGISTLKVGRES